MKKRVIQEDTDVITILDPQRSRNISESPFPEKRDCAHTFL